MLGNLTDSLEGPNLPLPHLTTSLQWWDAEAPLAPISSHSAPIGQRTSHSAPVGSRSLASLCHWQEGSRATRRHSLTPLPRPSAFVPAPSPSLPTIRENPGERLLLLSFLLVKAGLRGGPCLLCRPRLATGPLSRLPPTPAVPESGWWAAIKLLAEARHHILHLGPSLLFVQYHRSLWVSSRCKGPELDC